MRACGWKSTSAKRAKICRCFSENSMNRLAVMIGSLLCVLAVSTLRAQQLPLYLMYPANIPNLPGHSWPNAVAMATPIAHKGSAGGAKVQATTALDILLRPELVVQAWD